ncbi:hypothetical protein GCM10017744_004850 [Streptomyces antimycoticus]
MAKKGRTFVRGLTSETYGLGEFRTRQLASKRVRDDTVVVDDAKVAHSGDSEKSRTWWRIGPGDEEFLTQTVQVHFVQLPPQSSNHGHGHQNEAAFYILEGRGYEIHDDQRYDWAKDDFVFVHTDSVHRHFNPYDEQATALVVKAKSTWMFMGLWQQGRSGPIDRPDEFGPREDWSRVWTRVSWTARRSSPGRHDLGDHPARPAARAHLARAHRRAPVLRRRLRAGHPDRQPFGQVLEDGRRGALHSRRRRLRASVGGRGGDRGEVLRAGRPRAEPARDQEGRHAVCAAEPHLPALRPRRHAVEGLLGSEPDLQAPGLRHGPLSGERPEYEG